MPPSIKLAVDNVAAYAVILSPGTAPEIVNTGVGYKGLRDCQAYAQRLLETKQGIPVVGVFVPLTKKQQRDLANVKTVRNS